jgi:hypothetical protein
MGGGGGQGVLVDRYIEYNSYGAYKIIAFAYIPFS